MYVRKGPLLAPTPVCCLWLLRSPLLVLQDEMVGKLKDLGNMVLGKLGLSLDNFKADKDPSTGGYSIRFER